ISIAQEDIKITGTVKGSVGEELIGVSIKVKGTSRGTPSDINGNYVIDAPSDATLLVSYVGFEAVEIPVSNRTSINIILQEGGSSLDEVVIVAFGTQKKESVVGAQSTVRPSDLKVPSRDLTTALA